MAKRAPRAWTAGWWAAILASSAVVAGCTGSPSAAPPIRSLAPAASLPATPAASEPIAATPAPTPTPRIELPATSAGCASDHGDVAGDRTMRLNVAGVERTALVHVPPHAREGVAKALVLSL